MKFFKKQELQICDEYFSEEKPSTYTLAEKWDCDSITIGNILKRNGYNLRSLGEARKIFSKEEELQICNEYFSKEKPSTITLAKKCDCCYLTIRDIIIRYGYALRTNSESHKGKNKIFSKDEEQQICEEYFSEGRPSCNDLTKKWDCTQPTIGNIIKRNGYILRTHRETALRQIQNHLGPFKNTKPELKMKDILTFLHIPFETQFRVVNHLADFHLLNTNKLIEVDGDWYHGNPKKYSKLNKMQLKQRERDEKHNKVAKDNGYILLRFWESDILKNENIVKNKLMEVLFNG